MPIEPEYKKGSMQVYGIGLRNKSEITILNVDTMYYIDTMSLTSRWMTNWKLFITARQTVLRKTTRLPHASRPVHRLPPVPV
jgi:hypothetical protein